MTPATPKILAISLFAALASTHDAAGAAVPKVPPSPGPTVPANPTAKVEPPVVSEQSIYLPCYAFVPLPGDGGPAEDWAAGRDACHLNARNVDLHLAAPLQIQAAEGVIHLKQLRCFTRIGTNGDLVQYSAKVVTDEGIDLAKIEVQKKKFDGKVHEDAALPKSGAKTLLPLTRHYDVAVKWRVVVPEGEGWRTDLDDFLGCRVDYRILSAR